MTSRNWSVAEAKAKFSELLARAESDGPANHYPQRPHGRGRRWSGRMAAKN
jgi:hypothetical protein